MKVNTRKYKPPQSLNSKKTRLDLASKYRKSLPSSETMFFEQVTLQLTCTRMRGKEEYRVGKELLMI